MSGALRSDLHPNPYSLAAEPSLWMQVDYYSSRPATSTPPWKRSSGLQQAPGPDTQGNAPLAWNPPGRPAGIPMPSEGTVRLGLIA